MPINHDRKFIFIHIPKTAGTSLLCALFDVHVDKDEFVDSARLSQAYQRRCLIGDDGAFTRLHHYPLYKIARLIDPAEFFVFAFVRNPFDRLVSEYHFLRLNRSMPFDDFVVNVVRTAFEQDKLEKWFSFHFLPQTQFVCLDGRIRCDFVGRFESLEEDYRKICNALGSDYRPLPQYKKSKREHYRHYYSAESKAVVENLYKHDLETFDYEF